MVELLGVLSPTALALTLGTVAAIATGMIIYGFTQRRSERERAEFRRRFNA